VLWQHVVLCKGTSLRIRLTVGVRSVLFEQLLQRNTLRTPIVSIIFAILLLFILFTCRSKLDLHLFSFSSTASAFSSYQNFFIPFVVKEGVPDCSAEKFNLHRCRSFVSFCLKVQISLPHRRQGRAGALYAFILQYF